ncbi:MAG: hypothetical protein QM765_20635 [Myxococcales bacterium]
MAFALAGTTYFVLQVVAASSDEPWCRDEGPCITQDQERAAYAAIAVLAPLLMALPSSHSIFRISNQAGQHQSWGWTYLTAVLSNAAMTGLSAAMAGGAFGRDDPGVGLALTLGLGSLVSAGLQVLTLNHSGVQASAAPMVLKGGGGMALAVSF